MTPEIVGREGQSIVHRTHIQAIVRLRNMVPGDVDIRDRYIRLNTDAPGAFIEHGATAAARSQLIVCLVLIRLGIIRPGQTNGCPHLQHVQPCYIFHPGLF